MESQIKQQENLTVIEGGAYSGTNLSHSLEDLSVPSDCIVRFNNSSDIKSIFIAITGSSISNIDGLIQASGTANLFLINPNGITFGKNSSLAVGGSFFATTANSMKFADDSKFSTIQEDTSSLLTVSTPIELGFDDNSTGVIQVIGKSNQITPSYSFTSTKLTTM